jgi:acyl-CoA thioesterase-2
VGDLAADTAATAVGDGHYRATLSADWEIWGPMGGYVAACALRAVGAAAPELSPASLSCQFLAVAQWGEVDIRVEPRRLGRGASAYRVEVSQGGVAILDAMAWAVAPGEGLEHDHAVMPQVPDPDDLPLVTDLVPPGAWPPFPFWNNVQWKPIGFEPQWPPSGPGPSVWQQWLRFVPTATYDDVWADAARSVVLVDLPSWPSVQRHHAWRQEPYVAPTLDLTVAFHRPARGHEWLLCDGSAPVSTGGLFGWTARVWSAPGRLHASGGGQCRYRRLRSGEQT